MKFEPLHPACEEDEPIDTGAAVRRIIFWIED